MADQKRRPCDACRAEILFVGTAKSGGSKFMPLDPVPSDDGTVRVVDGLAYVTGKDAPSPRYVPHWATCPKANEFRRRR